MAKRLNPKFKIGDTLRTNRYLPPILRYSLVTVLDVFKFDRDFRYHIKDNENGYEVYAYQQDLNLPLLEE